MNNIIFKGKNSNNFKCLIISELPPITKPKMRTETTTIDGLDGDIIEQLGYASYDKTIKIGLKLGYMQYIDEIIKYFSGEGQLILSNEPDKYYNATCNYQIDYERLVKFRTAKVKFHIQPYKYLVNEVPIIFNITEETEVDVTNVGLEVSKPIMTLYGSGEVQILVNNLNVFTINIDDEYVTIDSEKEEAYHNDVLKNRQMLGDFPILKAGINTISWVGNITKIEIHPKSRWL